MGTSISYNKLKCHTSVLTEHWSFFLSKHSLDYCKPSVNFPKVLKVNLESFCAHVLITFMEGWGFKGPCFCHSRVASQPWIIF